MKMELEPDVGRDALVDDWLQFVLRLHNTGIRTDTGLAAAILVLAENVRLVANEMTEFKSNPVS